ncbi:MAG: hypothetical protein U0694_14375 [Anaerolineae bacterium]
MPRFVRVLCVFILPLLAACNLATTAPQDGLPQQNGDTAAEWAAYLYSPQRDQLLRVAADGSQTSFSFGVETENYLSSFAMSFSDDGRRVAYCQMTYQPESTEAAAMFYVREIATQTTLVTYDLGRSSGKLCMVGRRALAGSQVAVALVNFSPFEVSPDPSLPMWQILIIDTTSGALVNQIDALAYPALLDEQLVASGFALPLIQRFTGDEVIFAFTPFGGDGVFDLPSFVWRLESGEVSALDYWGRSGFDALPAGEIAYPDFDPTLPAGEPMGPMGRFNVLRIVDGGEPRTIYHASDWLIAQALFVNNGQQLALLLYPTMSTMPTDQSAPVSRWVALDRAGTITELNTSVYPPQVMPAPDGFVMMTQDYQGDNFQRRSYSLVRVNNGVSTTLWQETLEGDVSWESGVGDAASSRLGLAAIPDVHTVSWREMPPGWAAFRLSQNNRVADQQMLDSHRFMLYIENIVR